MLSVFSVVARECVCSLWMLHHVAVGHYNWTQKPISVLHTVLLLYSESCVCLKVHFQKCCMCLSFTFLLCYVAMSVRLCVCACICAVCVGAGWGRGSKYVLLQNRAFPSTPTMQWGDFAFVCQAAPDQWELFMLPCQHSYHTSRGGRSRHCVLNSVSKTGNVQDVW